MTSGMHRIRAKTLFVLASVLLGLGVGLPIATASAAPAKTVSIPKLMLLPSVNLVLSVGDVAKSKQFYGDVLQLKPMANLNLPGGLVMTRYQVGTTEIKFLHNPAADKKETGALDAAHGIRRLTLFFRDEPGLAERFQANGLAAPDFAADPAREGSRHAIASDPDGNEIELVVPPASAAAEVLSAIELRLSVSDLEKSRKFYRDFVGFAELKPAAATEAGGGTLHSYRYGNTTITLGQGDPALPTHSGRWEEARGMRYIQYIVRDLDAVDAYARSSGVTIEEPIFPLGNLARIMFIADPDGIINEFVGLGLPPRPAKRP
ncbi:MAG: VOC family protein [Pirellulales bacterium]